MFRALQNVVLSLAWRGSLADNNNNFNGACLSTHYLPYPPRRDQEHIPQEENEPSRSAEGAFPGLSTILRSFKRLSQLGP